MIHNFVIGSNEIPEVRIEKELQNIRNKTRNFCVVAMNVSPSPIGISTVTVQYTGQ
jgi:hypothetical protein